ncbi:hypothetical protein BGZ82_006688 [Podila clonocystis]|nr:hypothetical protein BGZ82_006688 [Podila clonocystis]
MTVTSFSISPYALCVGFDVCATAVGIIVAPATLTITGKYLGRTIYMDIQDFCSDVGVSCPVPVTATSITFCVLVKPSTPANFPFQWTYLVTGANGVVWRQTG